MPATPSLVDIQPLVRMVLAQLTGWDANLAVPALHAALCEITRAQFSGDATVSALTIIENTLAYYREHQQPLSGLSISETPRPQDVQ